MIINMKVHGGFAQKFNVFFFWRPPEIKQQLKFARITAIPNYRNYVAEIYYIMDVAIQLQLHSKSVYTKLDGFWLH